MPYANISDLPASVQHVLPVHAQKIYLEAFNHAFYEYHGREERAHRVAWAAVKKRYRKDVARGSWVPRD
ncbi:ChaB family protein [Massilia sp. TS11]|uniref:ChaB family protein n=1 Tax=Massilia sp. TS11 TaxID=2908003 RepID=UPI001EDB05D1|nr:ChaB family protein [Massilia sp. TS11]MCG2585215.1 ChaB family protein [Massilia sp. TS11]